MKPKVVHADAARGAVLPIEQAALAAVGAELVCAGATDADEIVAAAHDADVLLAEYALVTRRAIEGLARCQAIICYSVGVNQVETQAATEHGIFVVNIPGFCAEEVANHTILFILACAKKVIAFDHGLRAGSWPDMRDQTAPIWPKNTVYGERLGLVGFGNIARSVAAKAIALGMHVAAFDPYVQPAAFAERGVQPMALDALIQSSDYLSLHTPLTPATHHLIAAAHLRRMKRTAFFINTCRGAVVDEPALIQALQEGWIAGAGLDVFEDEPLAADSPLLAMENVVLTPHTAGWSDGSIARVRVLVAEEAARIVSGRWPTAIANPEVKGRSRFERRFPA